MIAPRRRLAAQERDSFASLLRHQYEAGASIRQLAQAHGRSFGNVRQLLVESGAELRPRGGNYRRKRA